MRSAILTISVLAAMVGAVVVAPSASRADDDGDQVPKSDDDAESAISRQGWLFQVSGLTMLPYEYESKGKYRKGEVTVSAKVTIPDGAECAATPRMYTISITSDVAGGRKTVAVGALGKVTAKVAGQMRVKIDADPTPGCDLMLEAGSWYSPDSSR